MGTTEGNFEKGDKLILFHKKYGFVRAYSAEDQHIFPGGLARLAINVNSENLPGIWEAVINTNEWEIYSADDIKVLKKIADTFVKYEYTH